jgi:hypothetical protein
MIHARIFFIWLIRFVRLELLSVKNNHADVCLKRFCYLRKVVQLDLKNIDLFTRPNAQVQRVVIRCLKIRLSIFFGHFVTLNSSQTLVNLLTELIYLWHILLLVIGLSISGKHDLE